MNSINDKDRIHWACRRGMRELDISIMPFFEYEYDTLNESDKEIFIRLLKCNDLDLFNWMINYSKPEDRELQKITQLIQKWNQERTSIIL